MVFKIDNVDVKPYIKFGGIKWSRNDVDGANAGRTQAGTMVRDRVAIKYRFDVTCRPLNSDEVKTVLNLINPEYFSLTFTDPLTGSVRIGQFYSNNIPMQIYGKTNIGETWTDLTFPVIEV